MRALLVAFATCAAACLPPPAPNEGTPQPQVTLQGVRFAYFKAGELLASGTARELTYQNGTSDFVAAQVALRIPGRAGGLRGPGGAPSGALDLTAPVARGALGTRLVDAEGGVTLKAASGLTGQTPRAHFDGAASTATGADPLTLRGDGYQLSSLGFTIDFPTERFTFLGGVRSRFGAGQ
jgi:hypothetical protein